MAFRWARPPAADLVLAAVLAVPLGTLSVMVVAASVTPGVAAVMGVAALTAHAALVCRRTAPLAAFAVVCAAFAAQTAVSGMFLVLPSVLVFPIALASCAAHGRRGAPALSLAAGLAGAAVVTARFATDPSVTSTGLRPSAWLVLGLLAAIVAAAWSLGLYRRVQLVNLELLRERARRAEAERERRARAAVVEERARIAREMHDIVAHSLAIIVSQAKGGRYAARSDPGRATDVLTTIEDTGRQTLGDIRGLLGVLRDPHQEGPAPQPTLRELDGLIAGVRAAGQAVDLVEDGVPRPLGPAAELAVFRLVQEALTNTLKHGGTGARSTVTLGWRDDALTVTVHDDADGPAEPGDRAGEGGHGLAGMRERLAAVGGTLSAAPAEPRGFTVTARLPYRERP